MLRTRRAFWFLLSSVVLGGLLVVLLWAEIEGRLASLRGVQVERLFASFAVLQLVAATLIVPSFAATAICGEREGKTYDMLYTTLLSPLSIIFSKWLSATGYVLILLVAGSPIVSALYLLGGISWATVMRAYVVTLLTVGVTGLICLSASMRSEQTSQAVFRGLVGTFFWNGTLGALVGMGVLLAQNPLGIGAGEAEGYSLVIFASLSPFYSLLEFTLSSVPPAIRPKVSPWSGYLLYMSVVGSSQLLYLLWRVRSPEGITARRRAKTTSRPRQRRQTWLTANLVRRMDRESSIPVNPLLAREIRFESLSQFWIRRVLFWTPLTIFFGFALFNGSLRLRLGTPAITAILLFVLLLPAIVAASLPREYERGTLDSMRSTLLTPRQIVLAKFFTGLHSGLGVLGAVFVAVFGAMVVHLIKQPEYPALRPLLAILSIPTLTLVFYCAVGTFASVLARRSLSALFITYATVLFLHLGLPFALKVLGEMGFHTPAQDNIIGATNTMVATLQSCGWLRGSDPLLGFLLFHGLGALAVLTLAVKLFERRCDAGKE